MELKAYAKINLGLDVLRRRPNGYHEVKMIMQTIGIYDELSVTRSDKPGIRVSTDREDLPTDKSNLVYKAADLLFEAYDITDGIDIKLKKNIPVAAGLAGGSTDAAAVLKAVNELWNLGLSQQQLMDYGVKIGADIPFCIMGGTVLSEGIGEVLTPISPCPACTVLIAKPPVGVSTAYVYQNLKIDKLDHPDIDAIIRAIDDGDIKGVADNLGNVLETVTIPLHPVIDDIKKMMTDNGAIASLMSGSGPTVFGLYDDAQAAAKAKKIIGESNLAADICVTELVSCI